ncbi:MAG TPA: pirin family protein [Polyangiaceae bacterium]|nr:pirin family protein [Polyangiaceae bacterium]
MAKLILETVALGAPPWPTVDPFLFCVHHRDAYPAGNADFGPAESLAGRNIGQDFAAKDGWNMYHGDVVPGFPAHPHRGFETVTIVRRGLIDHSDSLGATARFGPGDVQWLTAGAGIVHSEMFPLTRSDAANPLELFQIWLNLPASKKMAEPYFSMFWDQDIPTVAATGADSGRAAVRVVAGNWGTHKAPPPPPHSWAAQADSDVAIWTVRLAAGASVELPPAASKDTVRALYFFSGDTLGVGDEVLDTHVVAIVQSDARLQLLAGKSDADVLVLQGRPIGEPVAQHGPFVMNTREEIQQAFADYRRTQFGGWPWPNDAPHHGADPARFAKHADGRVEKPG